MGGGITSACAEQTRQVGPMNDANGDHLRVCGADEVLKHFHRYPNGITSACAEQTYDQAGVAQP